jgi:hypothetical protein
VPTRLTLILAALITVAGTSALRASGQGSTRTIVRVSSATPGQEVRIQGVLLVHGRPMRVVEQATPFEFRADRPLVFAAFEPASPGPLLRLELTSDTPEPAAVTAPRVMVGRQIGGVATEFVQGY